MRITSSLFLLYNNNHFSVIAENAEGTMAYWLLLHMAFVWNKSSHVELGARIKEAFGSGQ